MEDIKAKQQKLPIDRVAEKNIYEELKAQYDYAKQTGYGYRHESDLDAIFSRQAGILAASGLKSVYDIGTRDVDTFVTLKKGSDVISSRRREEGETAGRVVGVYQRNNDYFYDIDEGEGPNRTAKIDPASIVNVKQGVTPEPDPETGNREYYTTGLEIEVRDKPYRELINKRTNEPVYDVELQDNWREDPLAYSFIDDKIVNLMPSKGGFNRIHTNYGVRGAADISFQMVPDAQGNQVPLILPVYRSTSTDPTPLLIATAFLAGGLLGPSATAGAAGSGATAGTAAAGTGATAGTGAATGAAAGTGTAIVGTPGVSTIYTVANPSIGVSTLAPQAIGAGAAGFSLLEGAQFPVDGLQATASNSPSWSASFGTTTAGEGLLAPTVPGLSSMGGAQGLTVPVAGGTISQLGLVPTGAVPALGTDGFFGPSLVNDPNVLGNAVFSTDSLALPAVAGGGAGISALQAVGALGSLLGQPALPLASGGGGGGGGGGGQSRGVDFSPLYQNTLVGLLPLAERYRRSLI
jgi:hypothetical protein